MKLINLKKLQQRQFFHDARYHQDIISLSTQNKLKHIVLHFIKYLGKYISDTERNNSRLYADMFICCLTMANALKIRLSDIHNMKQTEELTKDRFVYQYTLSLSKMAKACEALDYVEAFPSYEVLTKEVNRLSLLLQEYLYVNEYDVNSIVNERWGQIEDSDIYH